MQIITLLNHSCSHCPRREFAETLRKLLAEMKGNLKNLAVGRMSVRISGWQEALELGTPLITQVPSPTSSTTAVLANCGDWPTNCTKSTVEFPPARPS